MLVSEAREVARRWAVEEGPRLPGFVGALTHGSVNWLAPDAILPPTSDVDALVILAEPHRAEKLGKLLYGNVLLEVSVCPRRQVQSPEAILRAYRLAGNMRIASILADPTGELAAVQAAVARSCSMPPRRPSARPSPSPPTSAISPGPWPLRAAGR